MNSIESVRKATDNLKMRAESLTSSLKKVRRLPEFDVSDYMNLAHDTQSAMDAIESADIELHANAALYSLQDWAVAESDQEVARLNLLLRCANVLLFGAKNGIASEIMESLFQRYFEWVDILDWDTSYADSPAFQSLMDQAVREYEAGLTEEGGWES